MKYEWCPNCGKKGLYTKYAMNVRDCISFGHRGSAVFCKYCNPSGVTKADKEEFEKLHDLTKGGR